MSKQCTKCFDVKPLTDFHKNHTSKDGLEWKCKSCKANYRKAYYEKNFKKELLLQKKRDKKIACKNAKSTRLRQPLKVKARLAVKHELNMGRLVRLPCLKCGNKKTEAHHEDYKQPLDVMWLCRKHHMEIHGKIHRGKL